MLMFPEAQARARVQLRTRASPWQLQRTRDGFTSKHNCRKERTLLGCAKNPRGLYTFLLDSRQISPSRSYFFSPFFQTTTTFHLLLLVIYYFPSIPVDCMRPTRDIRSPYVHASRARLNTCTSSTFVCTSREPSLPRLRRSVPPPVFSHFFFFFLLPSFC